MPPVPPIVALLRAQRATRRDLRAARRLPRMLAPKPVERRYLGDILDLIRPARDVVESVVLPELGALATEARGRADAARLDDYPERVERMFSDIRIVYGRRVLPEAKERQAREAAASTERWNRQQLNRQFFQLLRIDVIPPGSERADRARAFVRENTRLISSIGGDYLDELEGGLLRSFRQGERAEDIASWMTDRFDVAESRAARIARDQVGKLNGELTRDRQTGLGIDRYTWRTSLDERVRATHQALEGEVFAWSGEPSPPEGHPGFPIMCRCTAEPYLDDILDELAA